MPLGESLSAYWQRLQGELFPALGEEPGPLGERHRQLVTVLELARPERFIGHLHGRRGRPQKHRAARARGFLAKAVCKLSETGRLIERLQPDQALRRLCGCSRAGVVPSESSFSRALAEFAAGGLPARLHQALILETQAGRLTFRVTPRRSRRASGRPRKTKRRRGPSASAAGRRQGEQRPQPPRREQRRLQRQGAMSLSEMLAELPRACTAGVKQNAKG
jgi:hypothetical protein